MIDKLSFRLFFILLTIFALKYLNSSLSFMVSFELVFSRFFVAFTISSWLHFAFGLFVIDAPCTCEQLIYKTSLFYFYLFCMLVTANQWWWARATFISMFYGAFQDNQLETNLNAHVIERLFEIRAQTTKAKIQSQRHKNTIKDENQLFFLCVCVCRIEFLCDECMRIK